MDISVIIPSYNSGNTLESTLGGLTAQSTSTTWEVIVVDCSSDDRVEKIVRHFPFAQLEHRQERFNPGEGRNLGSALASGQLLVFCDADVTLAPDALAATWKRYGEGLEIFGGALDLHAAEGAELSAHLEHYFFNHENLPRRPPSERRNLSSALLCFDAELFRTVGGFRDIPRMQDTELTERMRREGHSLHFCPDILAVQTQDSPLREVLRKIFINGQNWYYIRHQRPASRLKRLLWVALLPGLCAAKVLRIILRHLVYQPLTNAPVTVALAPALAACGCIWALGLLHALTTEQGVSRVR